MRERLPLLGGLALLAIAFVIGSFAIGHGIRDKNRNDVISVTGSAKKRIVSDYIVWNLSVTSEQGSANAAAQELAGWSGKIRSFLTGAGITDGELSVQPISTETVSRKGRVTSFRLTRSFEIRSPRVLAVTDVADGSRVLSAGVRRDRALAHRESERHRRRAYARRRSVHGGRRGAAGFQREPGDARRNVGADPPQRRRPGRGRGARRRRGCPGGLS